MATIKIERLHEKAAAEMQVKITGTDSGAEYTFTLKRRRIEVEQKPAGKNKSTRTDWFNALSDAEKTQVFAIILDQYRNRSLGDNGFKGASIGVANERLGGQSRLFIGTNTTRWASPYFKHCAEQNMVNAATDTLMYERSLKPEEKQKTPRAPKFKSVYVLQAIDEHKVPISCPCGKCIDMLSNVMVGPESEVVTIPFLTDQARERIKKDTNAVIINKTAETLDEITLPSGRDTYEVWSTPIEKLNRNRTVILDGRVATMQRDALNNFLLKNATSDASLPEAIAISQLRDMADQIRKASPESLPKHALDFANAFIQSVKHSTKLLSQKIRGLAETAGEPAERAAANELMHRHSVATLDCAMAGGHVDLKRINQFMVDRIVETVTNRAHSDDAVKTMTQPQLRAWATHDINYVRCVAIQLDDGTFRYAVQAESKYDKAMPNAEVAALEQATESLGLCGVRHVWAMEMNPKDIEAGVIRTSPKEGIERLMKRSSSASPQGIDFHYLPFNNASYSSEKLAGMLVNLESKDVYPSRFKGADAAGIKGAPKPRSWAAMVAEATAQRPAAQLS